MRPLVKFFTVFTSTAWAGLASAESPSVQSEPNFEPPRGSSVYPTEPSSPELERVPYAAAREETQSQKGRIAGFMGWSFNAPIGSVRSFAAEVSPLGFELQLRTWVTSNLALGLSGEWATFVDDRPRTTYTVDTVSLTATSYNHVQTATARFLAHYYLLDQGSVKPYIGPHIGVGWSTFEAEAADLVLADDQVSFAWGLDAGAEFPLGEYSPVLLANLRYSSMPAAEFRNTVDNVQTLGLLLGAGF